MAKKNETLDLSIWITQRALADELGIAIQNVHNWVQRGKIKVKKLPGNTTLVDRTSLIINDNHYKRTKMQ